MSAIVGFLLINLPLVVYLARKGYRGPRDLLPVVWIYWIGLMVVGSLYGILPDKAVGGLLLGLYWAAMLYRSFKGLDPFER